jgi:Cu/Zn superoxide dismutase
MRSPIAVTMTALAALASGACRIPDTEDATLPGEGRPGSETEEPALAPREDVVRSEFHAPISSESDVSGEVTLARDERGGFRVEAALDGLTEGPHAWHIHSGACGTEAPVVAAFTPTAEMEGLGSPLTGDASGVATGSATVQAEVLSFAALESGEYSVHVHERSGADHGPTVACADL